MSDQDTTPAADAAYRAAYHIAWVGASNQKGVERSIAEHTATVGADHVAVRAMVGHLEFLRGNGLGPEMEELSEVRENGVRLGLA